MSRNRWKPAATLAALAGGAFLVAGSAAFADPVTAPENRPAVPQAVDDDCPHRTGAGADTGVTP